MQESEGLPHYAVRSKSPLVQTSAQQKWSRGADSLASYWAFTLSINSVIYFPEAVHGCVYSPHPRTPRPTRATPASWTRW